MVKWCSYWSLCRCYRALLQTRTRSHWCSEERYRAPGQWSRDTPNTTCQRFHTRLSGWWLDKWHRWKSHLSLASSFFSPLYPALCFSLWKLAQSLSTLGFGTGRLLPEWQPCSFCWRRPEARCLSFAKSSASQRLRGLGILARGHISLPTAQLWPAAEPEWMIQYSYH